MKCQILFYGKYKKTIMTLWSAEVVSSPVKYSKIFWFALSVLSVKVRFSYSFCTLFKVLYLIVLFLYIVGLVYNTSLIQFYHISCSILLAVQFVCWISDPNSWFKNVSLQNEYKYFSSGSSQQQPSPCKSYLSNFMKYYFTVPSGKHAYIILTPLNPIFI